MSWWHGINDLDDLILVGIACAGMGFVLVEAIRAVLPKKQRKITVTIKR